MQGFSLPANYQFILFSLLTLASVAASIALEQPLLMGLPVAVLTALLMLFNLSSVYKLFFILLPLSIEYDFSTTLATDLPSEPLMVALMVAGLMYYLLNPKQWQRRFINHPIIVLLLLQIIWISIAALYSTNSLVSVKFLLAKTWYIFTFVFVTNLFVKKDTDFKSIIIGMSAVMVLLIIRNVYLHALTDFDFQRANNVVQPFFRNHVNYAVFITLLVPMLLFALRWFKKGKIPRLLAQLGLAILFLGIALAFTRAAYVGLLAIPLVTYLVRKKLMATALNLVFGALLLFVVFVASNNNFIKFAPEYETTVYHANLEDHIIATFQGKDISFAERVYRWVAAGHMIGERPLTGFGPGNFYNSYRPYTVERVKTYVSDNLDKSGVHCYYLMLAADQGLPGLLLFALMIYYTFIRGQNLYHRLDDPKQKAFVLVFLQIVAIVLINLLVSDLIEVDKIGTIFYTAISIIAGFDARYAIAPKQQPNIN